MGRSTPIAHESEPHTTTTRVQGGDQGSSPIIRRLDQTLCGQSGHTVGTFKHCLGCGHDWTGPGLYCEGVCDCGEPACSCDCAPCPTCGAYVDGDDIDSGMCSLCPTWPAVEVPHAA